MCSYDSGNWEPFSDDTDNEIPRGWRKDDWDTGIFRGNRSRSRPRKRTMSYSDDIDSDDSVFYISDNLRKSTVKSNTKYTQNNPKYDDTNKYLLPSELDLDRIDQLLEKIMISNEEKKNEYNTRAQNIFEDVKNQLVKKLQQIFESLFDLLNNFSEYSLFGELIRKFQDHKNDFEMDKNPETTRNLSKTLKNLFSFDQLKNLYHTLDDQNIEFVLQEASSYYHSLFDRINPSWPRKHKDFSMTVKKIKESSGLFFDYLKSNKNLPFQNYLVNYKVKSEANKFINSELQEFKTKLKYQDEPFLDVHFPKVHFCSRMDIFKNRKDKNGLTLVNTYLCNKNKDLIFFKYIDRLRNTKSTKLYSMSLKDEQNKLTPIKEISGEILDLLVSPDDNYLAIRSRKGDISKVELHCLSNEMKKSGFCLPEFLDKNQIKSFIFLDSAEGLRFLFTDENGYLVCINLETVGLDFTIKNLDLLSVHYISNEQVLVKNKQFEFGVFSVQTKSVCNFVSSNVILEPSLSKQIGKAIFSLSLLTNRHTQEFVRRP